MNSNTALLLAFASVLCLVTLALDVYGRLLTRRYDAGLRQAVGHRVVVQTKDSHSIQGVLVALHADCLALEQAEYLAAGGARDVGGRVLVPRANFAFLQRVPAEAT